MTTPQRPPITIRGDSVALTDLDTPHGPASVLSITQTGITETMIILTPDGIRQLRDQCDTRLNAVGAKLAVASADERSSLGIKF